MPGGNEVGNDVWGFLATVVTVAIGATLNALRGWKNPEAGGEPKQGGSLNEEKYRKVYIESAELADLNVIRALPLRLDKIIEQLQNNYAIMRSVERIVDANHSIMTVVEGVVKQNNQILQAVHEIRDALSNAEKVAEKVRLTLLEKQIEERARDRERGGA